ncbi:uncharacterized protein LOC141641445 [Silene latifolia]|uniref:uncharacterized protein LOC141641445 n=1 Tax=Silene latifolia TaxID=37657 RepID=UPI003D7795BB
MCTSFQDSAFRRGLLEADDSIEQCLEEASRYQMPGALRRLFSTFLIYCHPKNHRLRWDKFYPVFSEDYAYAFLSQRRKVLQLTIQHICYMVKSMGKSFSTFDFGDLKLDEIDVDRSNIKEIEEELNIPISSEELNVVHMLNTEQRYAYDTIYRRVTKNERGSFFLDGSGGTGKTFLYKTLLANLRVKGIIAIAVASSGIAAANAAANLPGGRTSNSQFKIPLDIEENQSSQISKQSSLAKLIRACRLIIWDETPMAKHQAIEHFENTIRDVCSSSLFFCGKIVVFGGDFLQVLPIIPKITLREAINSSFVMSPLWPKLEKIHLTVNMCAMRDPAFGNFILGVGDSSHPFENGEDIKVPRSIIISGTEEHELIERLIDTIYPDIQLITIDPSLTTSRAILTPKTDDAQTINAMLVSKQEGEPFTYRSFDEAIDIATAQYPIEFLNTLQPSGLPPHELILKKNSPVILLRNLNPTSGLCNGTRLICKGFDRNVIDAEIAVGHHKGERVFIPRIPLQPSPTDKFPFQFKRK